MGAGIDPKTLHRWIYRRLYAIRLKLCAANICYSYRNLEISGDTFAIYYAGCSRASNGESCHWPVLRWNENRRPEAGWKIEGDKDYGGFNNPRFEDGLAMVAEKMGRKPAPDPEPSGVPWA